MPVIEYVPKGSSFYTVEIVNTAERDSTPKISMPSVYKMIATVMLRNGFEPGRGLGKNLQGIIKPIVILERSSKHGLGYQPTRKDRVEDEPEKSLFRPLPLLFQSFPI